MKTLLLAIIICNFQFSCPPAGAQVQSGTALTTAAAQNTVPVILTAGQSNTDGRLDGIEGKSGDTRPDYLKTPDSLCLASASTSSPSDREQFGRFLHFFPASGEENQPKRWAYDAVVYYLITQKTKAPLYVIKTSYGGTSLDPHQKCSPSKIKNGCNSWTKGYAPGYHWSADPQFLAATEMAERPFTVPNDTAKYIGQSLLKAFCANIDAGLNALKKQGKEPDIKCMLWHQGESDRNAGKQYHDNLKAMLQYIRHHLVVKTGNKKYATLPFFCGTVPHTSRQYNADVEAALYQLQDEDSNFHVIDLKDMSLQQDHLHFDAPAAEAFGQKLYEAFLRTHIF